MEGKEKSGGDEAVPRPLELREKLTAASMRLWDARRQLLRARVIIALLLSGTAAPCWWLAYQARETTLEVMFVGVCLGLMISGPAWIYALIKLIRGKKERTELSGDISYLKESREQLAETLRTVLANDDFKGGLAITEGGALPDDGALSVSAESKGALSPVPESEHCE